MDKKLFMLVVLAFVLVAWPAFVWDVPISQTDGASHYVYAKTLKESGLGAENPKYNWYGSVERYVNEYPPFSPVVLGFLMYIFDDVMLLNGLYGGIFAAIAVVFLYLFVKELAGEKVALLSSMLFLFNVRLYSTLMIGIYASSIAYFLTWPAMYFALLAFKQGRWNWLWAIIATGFISLTYPLHSLFVLMLQILLWLGIYAEGKWKVTWPKIESKVNKIRLADMNPLLGYVIGSLTVLAVVLYAFIFTTGHARASWVGQWIQSLMASNCASYPCIWKYFLLLDGPILVLAAVGGLITAVYRNKWGIAALGLGAAIIMLIDPLFIPGDIVMLIYVYRAYTLLFVLFAVLASYCFLTSEWKKTVKVFIVLMLILQAVKLILFFSQIGPAMLPEDVNAVDVIRGLDGSILYVNNLEEKDNFRSFKWIPVFVENENIEIVKEVPEVIEYDYLYMGDGEYNGTLVFSEGKTKVYKV